MKYRKIQDEIGREKSRKFQDEIGNYILNDIKGRFNEKNTFTISGGSALEGSIAKVFWQHYPLTPLPTTALFLLTFDLEKEYDEHEKKTKGTKKAIEFINSFFSIDIVVERLDPSADKSVC